MKTNDIISNASLALNKIGFGLQKKSPEILVVAGVIGVVAAAVMACKATTKAGAIAETAKESIVEINEAAEKGVTKAGEEYTEEDKKKDITITYVQTGIKYAKLYAPSIVLGAASIICIFASHNIMSKRNIALAAAYTTLDTSFKKYHNKIAERFGDTVEKELRYNVKAQEIEKTVTDENGKEKKVKEVRNVAGPIWSPSEYSPYSRVFDENNPAWMKDPNQSLFYLKALQAQANDKLKAQGHLFLNDVYEMLRYPKTDYGQIVGWIYDIKNPKGDNFVDFGLFEIRQEADPELGGDYITGFILDFNAVGNILNDLGEHQY